jgi:hypothetical protein
MRANGGGFSGLVGAGVSPTCKYEYTEGRERRRLKERRREKEREKERKKERLKLLTLTMGISIKSERDVKESSLPRFFLP